jgi:hypothetical protein
LRSGERRHDRDHPYPQHAPNSSTRRRDFKP